MLADGAIEAAEVRAYLGRVARAIERHARLLDRLDAALGDGDHGENMVVGWREVERVLEAEPSDDLGVLARRVGHTLVASVGGASGPLYGSAWIEAGIRLAGARRIDLPLIAEAFESGAAGLARRGRCGPGDKTIYDALAPAAAALRRAADEDLPLA